MAHIALSPARTPCLRRHEHGPTAAPQGNAAGTQDAARLGSDRLSIAVVIVALIAGVGAATNRTEGRCVDTDGSLDPPYMPLLRRLLRQEPSALLAQGVKGFLPRR